MKKLVSILALVIGLLSVQAAETQVTLASGANNVITTAPLRVVEAVLTTGSSALTVFLYDVPTLTTNVILAAYGTRSSYSTNIVTSYTDDLGNVNSITNSGRFTYTNLVAAVTNEATKIVTFYAPANATVTKTVDLRVVNGLRAYSSGVGTLTINYR